MRVLVTGGGGFVGRQVLPLLAARGHEVHALSPRGGEGGGDDGVRRHRADLLAPGEARRVADEVRPQALLHLAWYTAHGRFWTSLENYRWVGASLELFLACAAAGCERVVGTGTCAEYDWSAGMCDEASTPLRPATPYGACKLATGRLLDSLAERTGMRAAWARLFFLFGPHEHPDRLVPSVARALLAGEPAPCTHGGQLRDFLHVRDAASACVALLESGVTGPVNVASGVPVALRTVVEGVARHAGRPELVRPGARPAPPDDPPLLAASAVRLREEVGWAPALDLDAGLADAVAWWRARRDSNRNLDE